MKRILILFTAIIITCNCVLANDFKMYYDNGQNFYNSSQYTNAINEFKKALRINYKDNSARIGLVNSYLARGTYMQPIQMIMKKLQMIFVLHYFI